MGTQRLTERFAFSGGKVRRPGVDGYTGAYPVIEGVLLCGPESRNRRRYTREAFAGDRVKRYDGKPVYANHARGSQAREYQDQLGWVENPRHRADGMPVGDIGVKPTHPLAESFLFDAEHRPGNCGMSHVADCRTVRAADGWDDVTELVEAESVDVVVGPATTKGLYEQTGGRAVPQIQFRESLTRIRRIVEAADAARGKRLRKFLLEAEDDAMLAPVMDAPVMDVPMDGGDPDAQLWEGFRSAIQAVLDQYAGDKDAGAAVKAIAKYIKAHAKLATGTDAAAEEPAADEADEPVAESRPTLAGLIAEAKAAGIVKPTVEDVAAVEAVPTAAARRVVFERLAATARVTEAERPRSAGRAPGAGPLPADKTPTTKQKAIESVPVTGAGFAALIKG